MINANEFTKAVTRADTAVRAKALRAVVGKYADRSFAYGAFDCCQFARAAFIALRGRDPAPLFDYADESGADEIIEAHGTLEGLLRSILGEPTDGPLRICDVVLVRLPIVGEMVGVVGGASVIVPMQRGLERVPMRTIKMGWAI